MLGQRNLLRKTCGSTGGAGVGQRLVVSRAFKRNKQQQQQQQNRTGYADPGGYSLPPIDPNGAPPLPPQQPAAAPQQQRPAGPPQQQGWAPSPPPASQPGWGPNPTQIPAAQPGWGNNNNQQAGFNNPPPAAQPAWSNPQPGFSTPPPAAAPYAAPQGAPAQNPAGTSPLQNPAAANPAAANPGFAPQQGQQQQLQPQQSAAAGNGYGGTNYAGGWQTAPLQQQQGGYVNPNQQQGGYNVQQGGYNAQQGGYVNPNQQQGGFNTQQGGYVNPNPQQGGYVSPPNQQQQGGYNAQQGGYVNQPNQQQRGGYVNPPNQQQQGGYINTPNQQRGGYQPRQQNSWTDMGGFVDDQGGYMNDGGYIDSGRAPNDMGGFTTPPPQRSGWNQGGNNTGYYRNNNNRQQQQSQAFLDSGGYMNDTATGWAPLPGQQQGQRRAGFAGFDGTAGQWREDYLLQQLDSQMNFNSNMQMDAWQEEVEVVEDLTPKYVNGNRVLVNSEIEAPKVRVQDAAKLELGVMTFEAARELSIKQDVDVVLINKEGDPPVVRLISFSKYKYELEKSAKQKQKASKGPEIKEVKLRPVTEKADYDTKVKQAQKFLSKGAKVKLTMTFSGREMRFKDQGKEMMLQLIEELSTSSKMDAPLALRPSNFSVTLSPLK